MIRSTPLHSGWEFSERLWTSTPAPKIGTSELGWLAAEVPGHVHLDLVRAGVIEHPFYRMNELGCQWVDSSDWCYRTTFQFKADPALPRQVLRFDGLDTIASIYLNGEPAGSSDNMFIPLEIDVTKLLKEGENELVVDFFSAVRTGEERRTEYFVAEKLAPSVANFADRAFVRKAQYMFGWDWGPRLVSCGIWRPVRLIELSARILDVAATQRHLGDGSVELDVQCEIEGEGELQITLLDPFGDLAGSLDGAGTLRISEPVPWLPHSVGEPQLYRLLAVLRDRRTQVELDAKTLNVGLRTVGLVREPDAFGESFEFEVNGRTLWMRGANWIPDHSFPSVVSRQRYREQLERAVDLGCNMLRVWGGGLYETDDFYDLCDELGILVWQDFPFGCSYYPDDDAFRAKVGEEAAVNIKRLRSHPCLALWCGNNENLQMWFDKWGGPKHSPPRYYGERIYTETLPAVVAELDPERPYIASSAIGARGDGPGENPNRGGFGDQHNWDVWHGRGDWRYYADSTARFSSEYGFASSCSLDVWNQALDEQDWDPHSATVKWHDKTAKGHETFHGFVKLHYPEPVSLEDWTYYSQLNQRDALRFGVEHYRRSEFCKGSLIWQLNDCWPVQSWAILDSAGYYKALAYELRRLHLNSMCSIVRHNDEVTLWVINDAWEEMEGEASFRAIHLGTGEVLREFGTREISLAPGERRVAIEGSIAGLAGPDILLAGSWGFDETWQLVAEPKAARHAKPGVLTVSTYLDGVLSISTDTPLVDLWLLDDGSIEPFEENFVTVPQPGVFYVGVRRVPERLEARSLAGEQRVRMVRGPIE